MTSFLSLQLQKDFSAKKVAMPMKIHCNYSLTLSKFFRELCKMEKCSDLCIKKELGDDDKKLGSWSAIFSRAPVNSDKCLEACYFGCLNRVKDNDD